MSLSRRPSNLQLATAALASTAGRSLLSNIPSYSKRAWDSYRGFINKNKKLDLRSASARVMRMRKQPRSGTRARKAGGGAKAMTFQRDVSTGYSKKRRGRRGRKRTKRMYRQINRVIDSRLAKNLYTYALPYTIVSGLGSRVTYWDSVSLFGSNNAVTAEADLRTIFVDQHNSEHGGLVAPNNDKLTILSANLEIILRNEWDHALEIEIYTVVPKSDKSLGATNLAGYFQNGFSNTFTTSGTAITKTAVSASTLRTTPFDNKSFCSDFTILTSKKFLTQPGQTINYMFNQRKTKYVSFSRLLSCTAARGLYKGFLIRIMGLAGTPGTGTLYTIGWKKSYSITRLEENEGTAQAI